VGGGESRKSLFGACLGLGEDDELFFGACLGIGESRESLFSAGLGLGQDNELFFGAGLGRRQDCHLTREVLKTLLGLFPQLGNLVRQRQQFIRKDKATQFHPPFGSFCHEANQIMKLLNREGHASLLYHATVHILSVAAKTLPIKTLILYWSVISWTHACLLCRRQELSRPYPNSWRSYDGIFLWRVAWFLPSRGSNGRCSPWLCSHIIQGDNMGTGEVQCNGMYRRGNITSVTKAWGCKRPIITASADTQLESN
jgi:hypothetical protein